MPRKGQDVARLLTASEVARMMRVSRMTVYRLIRGGSLRAVRVGRNYRVHEEDLTNYLASSAIAT